MIAVLTGLGAAVIFGVGALAGAAATKEIGSAAFSAWMMLVGFAVVVPWILVEGAPLPDLQAVGLMLYVGTTTLVGVLVIYSALREGAVSVVIPIVSAEGAVTAAIAWVAGDVPGPVKLLGMLVVVGAVITLVALSADPAQERRSSDRRAAVMAAAACLLMGTMLFAQGHLGGQVSLAWSVLPARAVTVALLVLPLAARGRLRLGLASLRLVVLAGVADVVAIALLVVGGRHDIAVTAVLASQYSVVAVVLAAWLLGERLRSSQRWAVGALVCGVALVAWSAV